MHVISTVTNAAASYDLTDLATVKAELTLSDTTNDAFLGRIVTRASKDIARQCNRAFSVESVKEDFYVEICGGGYYGGMPLVLSAAGILARPGEDSSLLQLCRYPIVAVASVLLVTDVNDSEALVQDTDFKVDANKGWLLRTDATSTTLIPWEWSRITAQYDAGFGSDISGEVQTIPATPFQVNVANAAAFSIDKGVTFVIGGAALAKVSGTPAAGQYALNATRGQYVFAAADTGKSVAISYGYNQIPEDLAGIATELVVDKFRAKGRESRMMERTQGGNDLGTQRFWVGAMGDGPFPPQIMKRLERYMVPSFA